jgi:hypothetical protein
MVTRRELEALRDRYPQLPWPPRPSRPGAATAKG